MSIRLLAVLSAIAIAGAAAIVEAHHSAAAEFDSNVPIKLRGTITKFEWINPHSWIYLDVKGADGTVEHWEVEAGPPAGLVRRGFTKASVAPGTEVLIEGHRARDGSRRGNVQYLLLPDGRNLFAGSPGEEKQAPKK
jgi:hypothetical protein